MGINSERPMTCSRTEREAFWRHVMSDTFAPVTIREMAEGDVAGSIRGHWVGRLLVTHVRSTGQDIRRTPRLISEADNAYFQVAVVTSGIGRISQDDRQAVLRQATASCTRRPDRSNGCSTATGTSGSSRCRPNRYGSATANDGSSALAGWTAPPG